MYSFTIHNSTFTIKIILLLIILLGFFGSAFAQDTLTSEPQTADFGGERILLAAEQMPEPKKGYKLFYKYVSEQIKTPQKAIDKKVNGYVFVSFVVSETGKIYNVKILRGIGEGCNEEVLRVFETLPDWKPARNKNKRVKVRMTFTVIFRQ